MRVWFGLCFCRFSHHAAEIKPEFLNEENYGQVEVVLKYVFTPNHLKTQGER